MFECSVLSTLDNDKLTVTFDLIDSDIAITSSGVFFFV